MSKKTRQKGKRGSHSTPLFNTWALWGVAAASLVGVGLAVYTTLKTLGINTALTRVVGCRVSDVIDCDPVLASDFALMFGIPVASWGLLFYVFTLVVALLALYVSNRDLNGTSVFIGFGLSVFAVLFSVYKAYQLVVLGYVCPFCIAMYIVNVLLLVFFWLAPVKDGSFITHITDVLKGSDQQTRFSPSWGPGLLLVAVVFGAGFMVTKGLQESRASNQPASMETLLALFNGHFEGRQYEVPMAADTPMKGNADAPVSIHVFSDFQCPGCKQASQVIEELYKEFPDDVKVYYMHYPLDSAFNPRIQQQLHPYAGKAAVASMCAQDLGDFWGYHDKVFAGQALLSDEFLSQLAVQSGWDEAAFATCMEDSSKIQRVKDDLDRGRDVGVGQTPSIYINGRLVHSNYWSNLDLQRMIVGEEVKRAEENS